ncbi:MAG: alcohol dehydrogenase [Pseudomonadota bacterium]
MNSFQVEKFGRPLVKTVRDLPIPHGREVVIDVGACGVCHSDLHLRDGYFDLGDGNQMDLARGISLPRTLGHEIAGAVVAMGPEAAGVAIGDRRVVFPWIGCGACALCRAGAEHLCNAPAALGVTRDGGFADRVLVPDPKYLIDYDPVPEEQACTYACSGLTAYSALKKAAPFGHGECALIIGAGGVGLSGIRLIKALYDLAPVVAELDQAKWKTALAAGAARVIDPGAEGAAKELLRSTGGGVAVAIDFVGAAASFAFGLHALRKGGKLIVVGLFGGSTRLAPPLLVLKAASVIGSYVGSLGELRELMAIARTGTLPPVAVSARPLEAANETLDDLKGGRIVGRAVLVPRRSAGPAP